MKFRKKPVVVEAKEYTGTDENTQELLEWGLENSVIGKIGVLGDQLTILTLEGIMYANVGDWIIQGVKGEFYPCKPDIFELTYEQV